MKKLITILLLGAMAAPMASVAPTFASTPFGQGFFGDGFFAEKTNGAGQNEPTEQGVFVQRGNKYLPVPGHWQTVFLGEAWRRAFVPRPERLEEALLQIQILFVKNGSGFSQITGVWQMRFVNGGNLQTLFVPDEMKEMPEDLNFAMQPNWDQEVTEIPGSSGNEFLMSETSEPRQMQMRNEFFMPGPNEPRQMQIRMEEKEENEDGKKVSKCKAERELEEWLDCEPKEYEYNKSEYFLEDMARFNTYKKVLEKKIWLSDYDKKRYEKNREEIKDSQKAYYNAHKDDPAFKKAKRGSNKAYYHAHKDEIKDSQKAYRDAHKDDPAFRERRREAVRRCREKKKKEAEKQQEEKKPREPKKDGEE